MLDVDDIELPGDHAFWELVALARGDWERFRQHLRELPTPAVAGFAHMFYGFECSLADRASELIPSEDSAEDFCGWIVARGRDYYVLALGDPQRLDDATVALFDSAQLPRVGIDIRYEAESVYFERTGEHLETMANPLFDPYESEQYGPIIRAQ